MSKMRNSIEGRGESLIHTGASCFGDYLALNFIMPHTLLTGTVVKISLLSPLLGI